MVSPARQAAYQILRRVETGRIYAVDLLQGDQVSRLRESDRRLVTELVMGVLRWRGDLDFEIERLSGKPLGYFDPEIATILRLAIYQIRYLEKIPKAAAVNEAVELVKAARKRSAAGLVNAVLRKCEHAGNVAQSLKSGSADPETIESASHSMPRWLLDRWERRFGLEAARLLAWSSVRTPPTILRVTGGEGACREVRRELAEAGIRAHPAKYAKAALIVESGDVRSSGAWREGRVVIQDEASQLVGSLLAPEPGECALDLCAAPGMKSAQLATALTRGTLVACDLSDRRLRTMTRLLPRQLPADLRFGAVRLDATRALPFGIKFDRILLDVPCSGTGTLARNPEIKWRLRPEDLPRLAAAQAAIGRNALEVLKPGGRLVYATCSLEPEENEQVVETILAESPAARRLSQEELRREFPDLSALFDRQGYFRTRPDFDQMDGFFAAVIVREE
jgi:16S rRNA (cytosine967-C5)-methyltransferase